LPTMYKEEVKLCLKWNEFQENAISTFGTLREDREFADVTLVCEDGQQVEVHKVILASSSPFFLNILKRNKHPHPLIYLRGLKSEELLAMVDFIYFGEANVYQEKLDSFLAVAEELQLKGLKGSSTKEEAEQINKPPVQKEATNPVQKRTYTKQKATLPDLSNSGEKVEFSPYLEGTVAVTDLHVVADLQDLDDKIKSMMMFSENVINAKEGRARICKVCGKEGQLATIAEHIEANHITGVSHNCNTCGTVVKTRHSLNAHKSKFHTTK